MKKILLITFVLLLTNIQAQITYIFTQDSGSTCQSNIGGVYAEDQLMIVNFEVSGEQYVNINRHGGYIGIYDMSHTLKQTISLSGLPLSNNGVNYRNILYLSQHLFNLDSKIEFMYSVPFPSSGGGSFYTGIYNENGTLLFSDTGTVSIFPNVPLQQFPIYNTTSNGTQMILSYINGQAKVFGLAGTLTTAIQIANQNLAQAQGLISNPAPNPVINITKIDYALPKEANQGEIVFYDLQGTEIKRFKVDKTFDHLLISTSDMPAGTYYYQLQTVGNSSVGKKMVVVK